MTDLQSLTLRVKLQQIGFDFLQKLINRLNVRILAVSHGNESHGVNLQAFSQIFDHMNAWNLMALLNPTHVATTYCEQQVLLSHTACSAHLNECSTDVSFCRRLFLYPHPPDWGLMRQKRPRPIGPILFNGLVANSTCPLKLGVIPKESKNDARYTHSPLAKRNGDLVTSQNLSGLSQMSQGAPFTSNAELPHALS